MNESLLELQQSLAANAMVLHPTRADVVREAFEWIGTPYCDCGSVKGPGGAVDCAMLLICIFQKTNRVPADYDPRPYSPDWHLHQNEKLYMAGLEKFSHRVGTGMPGDVSMFRFGRHASHGALIVSDTMMIHAHRNNGFVELCERSALAHWHDSDWSVFE